MVLCVKTVCVNNKWQDVFKKLSFMKIFFLIVGIYSVIIVLVMQITSHTSFV